MNKSTLEQHYYDIDNTLKTIYVTPSIERTKSHNSYLFMLYKEIIEKKELNSPNKQNSPKSDQSREPSAEDLIFGFAKNLSINQMVQLEVKSLRVGEFATLVIERLRGKKTLLHHHWFGFYDARSFLIVVWTFFWVALYKMLGGKVVWTIHNKIHHKKRYTKANLFVRRYFAKLADKIHVHCPVAIDIMMPILDTKREKFFVVEHPLYETTIFSKSKAISQLKILYGISPVPNEKTIFLIFGTISAYKGILEAVEVFNTLQRSDYALWIIGGGNEKAYVSKLSTVAQHNPNILIINKLIPEKDLDFFFCACDSVLFNYQDILTSGGVYLAMSYHKKVIVPNIGCLSEIGYENKTVFEHLDKTLIEKEIESR